MTARFSVRVGRCRDEGRNATGCGDGVATQPVDQLCFYRDRTSRGPGPTPGLPTNGSPAEPPGTSSAPSVPVPGLTSTTDTQIPGLSSQQAIRLAGRTQVWNGDTQAYETVAQFTRDAQLFLVAKEIGGGTAFAILSGQLFEVVRDHSTATWPR
jgi:hypothetical protein